MAKVKPSSKPQPETPQVSPAQGIQLLTNQIARGEDLLKNRPLGSDQYETWLLVTQNCLEKAFGRHSPNISSVIDAGRLLMYTMGADARWWEQHRVDRLTKQVHKLGGLRELLQTEMQLAGGGSVRAAEEPAGHKIFLVHGHADGNLHEVARFLETLEQHVIVLREQPNQGSTVIEKFEAYADVGFAVVLLTPDDLGNTKGEAAKGALNPRARQNVVFEWGYFIGRLSRKRVCALYAEGVEIPSDYSGVLYIQLDTTGRWRLELAKELKAAGFPIDMNLAL